MTGLCGHEVVGPECAAFGPLHRHQFATTVFSRYRYGLGTTGNEVELGAEPTEATLHEIPDFRAGSLDERISRLAAETIQRQETAEQRRRRALGAAKMVRARLTAELASSKFRRAFKIHLVRSRTALVVFRRDIRVPLMELAFWDDGIQVSASVSGILNVPHADCDTTAELVAEQMAASVVRIPVIRRRFVDWRLVALSALVASAAGATTAAVLLLL